MSETRTRELRIRRGWTQERLAEASEVTVRTVQRSEAGSDVSLDTMSRLARALGVPVEELVGTPAHDLESSPAPSLTDDDVRHLTATARSAWARIALAVALFVTSPVPVVLLIAGAAHGVVPTSVEAAIAVGIGALLLLVAVGTLHLVRSSDLLSRFDTLRAERAHTGPDARPWSGDLGGAPRQRSRAIAVAVTLWALAPLPLVVVALLGTAPTQGLWIAATTSLLLVVVALGVFIVLRTAWSPYVAERLTART